MLSPLTSTRAESTTAAELYAQDAQHHRAVLNELIDIGADMVRLGHQQAKVLVEATPPSATDAPKVMDEFAAAFERITRSVRRCALLVRKLAEPLPVADPARRRVAARQHIIRAVEDAIQFDVDGQQSESLHAEFLDRLDSPDLEDDIGDRPVADIIAEICRDLGLDRMLGRHPWARRTPAALAVLQARAAAGARPSGEVERSSVDEAMKLSGSTRQKRDPRCRDP